MKIGSIHHPSDAIHAPEAPEEIPVGLCHHSLMEIFEQPSFRESFRRVLHGLRQPHDSGEYKYARIQLQRLLAPVAAIVVPLAAVLVLIVSSAWETPQRDLPPIRLTPPEKPEPPLDPPEPIHPEEPAVAATVQFVDGPDLVSPVPSPSPESASSQRFDSPQMVLPGVQKTVSPVVMPHIYSQRPGLMPGPNGGPRRSGATEEAVVRALRWLKEVQETDGSWTGTSGGGTYTAACAPAMTGLALLAFLGHGETQASQEFGPTVERATKWLLAAQQEDGRFRGSDGHEYSLPIAASALCESQAMTPSPLVQPAAEKAMRAILEGQHPNGGWDYNCRQSSRTDTSVMAWCVQALKAARAAKLRLPGLDEACLRAAAGLRVNAGTGGGFGYDSPGASPLTGASALGLQLMGAGRDADVCAALQWLDANASCSWSDPWGANPLYYWYYTTQASFQAGGPLWKKWNSQFARELTSHQEILKGASADGKDMGYWPAPSKGEHAGASRVYNTTLCALMLEVYYRYISINQTEEKSAAADERQNVDVPITF